MALTDYVSSTIAGDRVCTLFSETIFQDFSRIFPGFFQDFSRTFPRLGWIFPGLLNSLQLFHSQDLYVNSPYCLPYISYFSLEFYRFPELSRTSSFFPGTSSSRKCHDKIPGLPSFSRTRTNPVEIRTSYKYIR